jgi:hypothetical protein
MTRACVCGLLVLACAASAHADDPVFSGPQAGEKLPPLVVKPVFGDRAGQEVDFIQEAGGKPLVLVFFHSRTRLSFGLTNAVMRYAATRQKDGLALAVVFLTDDATETENWTKVAQGNFSPGPLYAISPDGQEGPGAYGLNRTVSLTILVAKEGRVTSNFAIIQPSVQADGPKLLKAIVDVLGGGEVPDISQYDNTGRMMARPAAARGDDPKLRELLSAVINKQATPEQVAKAAEHVEEYVKGNAAARIQLGRSTKTIVDSGKLSNYGTEPAQQLIKQWAETYGRAVAGELQVLDAQQLKEKTIEKSSPKVESPGSTPERPKQP